jgi:hypothetical protein
MLVISPKSGMPSRKLANAEPPVDPVQVVGKNITILYLHRGQEGGAADGNGAVSKINFRQPAVDGIEGNARIVNAKRGVTGNVLIEVKLETVSVNAIVAGAEFIGQRG